MIPGTFVGPGMAASDAGEPLTMSFVEMVSNSNSTSVSTASETIPAAAQVGDLGIAAYSVDQSTDSLTTVPTGWTSLIPTPSTTDSPRMYVFVKILEAGDPGSTLSATISPTEGYQAAITIFRPANRNLTGFTARNIDNQKGSSSLSASLTTTSVVAPTLAIANLTGRNNQSPVMTFSGATIETNVNGGTRSTGYIFYDIDGTPASHSVTSNDTGRQSLTVYYLDLAHD